MSSNGRGLAAGPPGVQHRVAVPSMAPPKHLPFHIIPPEKLEKQREQARAQLQQQKTTQVLQTWAPPKNHPAWRTSTLSFKEPKGPAPAPPPSKPITEKKTIPVLPQKKLHPPSMAPPRHLPTNIIPPTDSLVLPLRNIPVYQEPKKEPPLPSTPKPNKAAESPAPKKRKKKKKRLNKFNSAEIQRPQEQPKFVPKANPLPPIVGISTANPGAIRGRRSSKNATSAFYTAASPNGARFDNAMEKMQAKMKRQTKNNDFLFEPKSTERSRQKSRQVQSKLSTQFGFLQTKFSHKDRQNTRQRKKKEKPRAAPALSTQRKANTDNGPPGITSWV